MNAKYLHSAARDPEVSTDEFNKLADAHTLKFVELSPEAKIAYNRLYEEWYKGSGVRTYLENLLTSQGS